MTDILSFEVCSDEIITLLNIVGNTDVDILLDEFFIMTGSKKLIDYLKINVGKQFDMYRMKSKHGKPRLILCHCLLEVGYEYYNVSDYNKYKCIGLDVHTGEAMMKQIHGKKKLVTTKNNLHWAVFG